VIPSNDLERALALATKNKTVLVVDDEPGIRKFVHSVLLRQGYQVMEAEDGLAAYELLHRHSRDIQLLVTDIVMPRMNGIALAAKVRTEYPDVEVLYISGFVSDLLEDIPIERLLPKPFAPGDLVQCVQRLCA
jgi:CheY-like chemotaxis protein